MRDHKQFLKPPAGSPMTAAERPNGYAVSRDLNARLVPLADLRHFGRETRKHPAEQIKKIARSLDEFGFVLPIVIDAQSRVVAGWALVLGARKLGLTQVPAVTITDLSEARLRALRLALNRLGEDAKWDTTELALEFSEILELETDFDLTLSGFAMGEVDVALASDPNGEEDELPALDENAVPVSKLGDLWQLGEHRILCGDALQSASFERLLGSERAEMVFADPPYNVPIAGNVSGLGRVKHDEFQMASGEMSSEEFIAFLTTAAQQLAAFSTDGSIQYLCMDWRHMGEMLAAGNAVYSELKNLAVWNKSNAGMGSLYRSKHELVFIFKNGKAPHINNVELGRHGRSRSNVWDYPGQNTLNGSAKSKLALHATAKPVGLVADAIRDCSNRGGIVLDSFGGAGTTLIAAERTGRRARLIEIEPRFVDVTVRRWQRLTGGVAVDPVSGRRFGETQSP
jgi:DNA modification methylase